MKHGSLFSGIGGFELAAEWMGWENVFHCEWNEFGKKVLKYYWPNAVSYDDITKTDFTIHRGGIDILTGGFPCQPYSMAGKRLGKEDDRHLWPEMLRTIREVQPRWVVGENVLGLINWNGGLVFDEVQADLEAEGYEVWPYVLPAVSVNAPHRRDRIWFVARKRDTIKDTVRCGCLQREFKQEGTEIRKQRNACPGDCIGIYKQQDAGVIADTGLFRSQERQQQAVGLDQLCEKRDAANPKYYYKCKCGYEFEEELGKYGCPNCCGEYTARITSNTNITRRGEECQPSPEPSEQERQHSKAHPGSRPIGWERFPTTQPTIRGRDDGFSSRLDGITFPKWRNESIKAYGNAIVPQVAYQIFKAIEAYERL